MNVFLWIVQAFLAAGFAVSGLMKVTLPMDRLATTLPWVRDFPPATVRFIGVTGLLGAAGLILPAATGIAPVLTPLAACGLAATMLLAARTHLRRGEPEALPVNGVLLALAVLVAWGRFGPYAW
ncbi:DoxX family protein [Streptomyces avicenniae]|uniref:DoxX family protein n=1 Tax=Streptomyces avicenniae TaxID=500153 RepID=UPI00069A45A8|nr:DoxX family protein [Streptomyces avicenniae]